MPLTFLIPDLVRLAGDVPRLAMLELMLTRADARPSPEGGMDGLLAELFGLPSIPAVAPLTRLADTGQRDDAFWFRADPVHLAADRDQLVMLPPADLEIEAEEAHALAATFNQMYADDGFRLETPTPSRWYLGVPKDMDCETHDPEYMAGGPVFDFMPSGPDASQLKQLMNEVQMLFHEHPVNQARETAGKQLINTVWLWGGGRLPEVEIHGPRQVMTDLALVRGLALFAGSGCTEWPGPLDAVLGAQTGLLALHADDARGLEKIEMHAAQPLLHALRRGNLHSVDIYPGGTMIYRITRPMLRRFWRSRRALKELPGQA